MLLIFIPVPTLFVFSSSTITRKAYLTKRETKNFPSYKISPAISPFRIASTGSLLTATMPKNIGFLICLLIMALDITAGILSIEAEVAQNKACLSNFKLKLLFQHFDNNNPELFRQQVKHLRLWIFECREPSHKAFNLGLAAAVLLALAHVIANLLGGCVCFWSREDMAKASANRQLAVFSLIFAWYVVASSDNFIITSFFLRRRHYLLYPWIVHSCLLCIRYCLGSGRKIGSTGWPRLNTFAFFLLSNFLVYFCQNIEG